MATYDETKLKIERHAEGLTLGSNTSSWETEQMAEMTPYFEQQMIAALAANNAKLQAQMDLIVTQFQKFENAIAMTNMTNQARVIPPLIIEEEPSA